MGFRLTHRRVNKFGLSFSLPSHYHEVGKTIGFGEETATFMSGWDGSLSMRRIGVGGVVRQTDHTPQEIVDATIEELLKKYPGSAVSDFETPLGPGKSWRLVQSKVMVFTQDLVAARDGRFIRIMASYLVAKAVEAEADLAMVRRTLGNLEFPGVRKDDDAKKRTKASETIPTDKPVK